MHRHYSFGTTNLVALLAAQLAAREARTGALAQAEVSRIRASLNGVRDGEGADRSDEFGRREAVAGGPVHTVDGGSEQSEGSGLRRSLRIA